MFGRTIVPPQTTTVQVVQPQQYVVQAQPGQQPAGQYCGAPQPTTVQVATGVPMQTTMQTFNIGNRRRQAHISCCGHTLIWTWFGFAVAFLVLGLVLTPIFAEDRRSDRINAYNDYVKNWKVFLGDAQYENPDFKVESTMRCNNKANYKNTTWIDLVTDSTNSDLLLDGASKALPLAPQYKFVNTDLSFDIPDRSCYFTHKFYLGSKKLDDFITPVIETRSFKCDKECEYKCYKKHYGYIDYSGEARCYYPVTTRKVCIKVSARAAYCKLERSFVT